MPKIKANLYGLVFVFCVMIVGCGKPEIKSDCNLNGNGNVHCAYNNKGGAKGSLCEHITLKPIRKNTFNLAMDYHNAVTKLRLSGKFGIDDKLENLLSERGVQLYIADASLNGTFEELSTWKQLTPSERTVIQEVDKRIRTILNAIPEWDETKISSSEICSGIVDAGDVREVNGYVSFDGLPPSLVCRNWPSSCIMSTVPSNMTEKMKQNAMTLEKRGKAIEDAIAALVEK